MKLTQDMKGSFPNVYFLLILKNLLKYNTFALVFYIKLRKVGDYETTKIK